YAAMVSPDGANLYVSIWGGAKIAVFNAATLAPQGEIAVGEHPNAMVQSRDGSRLFVACANTNAVWVVDPAGRRATEQIRVAPFPKAPPGTTPNALALTTDGATLAVANADNNTVAMVDVEKPGASRVQGFIPTGWYPTAIAFDRDGRRLYVLSGKGLAAAANPRGPQPGLRGADGQDIAQLLQGALSEVAGPDAAALADYTKRVYELTPYKDAIRLAPADAPIDSAIPAAVGKPSPIKHVFYVIRENRTYDQILGDLPRGNGDPNLA